MVKGLCHTGISTVDMEKSIWFYCDLLGGRIILEVEEPKGTPWIKTVRFPDGTCLELFYQRAEFPLGKDLGRNHFCFAVEHIEALSQALHAHGITVTQEVMIARDGNKQLWCLDPNGYRVEFMEFMPGCPQLSDGPKVVLS